MLIERMGYRSYDFGPLAMAGEMENMPLSLFPQWKAPLLISTLLWFFLYFLEFCRYYICPHNEWGWYPFSPKHITNLYHYDLIKQM